MSVEASAWAWSRDELGSRDRLVLLALADHADREGCCFPGQGSIAQKTGLSRDTVGRAVRHLERAGYLEREPRTRGDGGRTSDLYKLAVTPPAQSGTPSAGAPPAPGQRAGEAPPQGAGDVNHQGKSSVEPGKVTPLDQRRGKKPRGDRDLSQLDEGIR